MLETIQILKAIEENNAKDLLLKVKNTKNGEVLGVDYNYVADEILFLFASKEGKGTCANYLTQLKYESYDKCWDSYICDDEDFDNTDEIEDYQEKITKSRYEVVTGLNTRVYVGNQNDCPIRCFDETFEMTGIELTDDALVLLY